MLIILFCYWRFWLYYYCWLWNFKEIMSFVTCKLWGVIENNILNFLILFVFLNCDLDLFVIIKAFAKVFIFFLCVNFHILKIKHNRLTYIFKIKALFFFQLFFYIFIFTVWSYFLFVSQYASIIFIHVAISLILYLSLLLLTWIFPFELTECKLIFHICFLDKLTFYIILLY